MTLERKLNALLGIQPNFTVRYAHDVPVVHVDMYMDGPRYTGSGATITLAVEDLITKLVEVETKKAQDASAKQTFAEARLKVLRATEDD